MANYSRNPRVAQRQRTVTRMQARMRWLEEAASRPSVEPAALAELRDLFPKRRTAEVPPTDHELARQQLAARLRNLEVLVEELRDVVDAAGDGATVPLLDSLTSTCGDIESTLSEAVDNAARDAGVDAQ